MARKLASLFMLSAAIAASLATAQVKEVGVPTAGAKGIKESVASIMEREFQHYPGDLGMAIRFVEQDPIRPERSDYDRRNTRERPGALKLSQWPAPAAGQRSSGGEFGFKDRVPGPFAVGIQFDGAQLNQSGSIPPDSQGDVGPTQVLVAVNGRIRLFDKAGNLGALNADLDVFFQSVRNGVTCGDPRVRFDRLTNKWYVSAINFSAPNRVLLAVSSGPTITGAASFTFFQFQQDLVGWTISLLGWMPMRFTWAAICSRQAAVSKVRASTSFANLRCRERVPSW
jgi:hypothetical protein